MGPPGAFRTPGGLYNHSVSRWKPEKARKKGASTGSRGRLVSCLVVLFGMLLLFFLLFSQLLTQK